MQTLRHCCQFGFQEVRSGTPHSPTARFGNMDPDPCSERWSAGQDAFHVPFPDVHPCGIGDSSACDPGQVTVTPHVGFHTCALSGQMLTEGRCWVLLIFSTSSLPHSEHYIRFVALRNVPQDVFIRDRMSCVYMESCLFFSCQGDGGS